MIPKRISTTIMNSLKGGVVPRIGLEHIAVGRKSETQALMNDIELISEGGAAFRFIVGKYGSGKSFMLQMIRNAAMEKGFVLVDADLSPARRLHGTQNQGLATYRELISNMSTKTKPDGGALTQIIERWISNIQTQVLYEKNVEIDSPEFHKEVSKRIYIVVNEIEEMVNGFDFARAIVAYYEAFRDMNDEKKSMVLRWFRGEYATKSEARRDLGINSIVTDQNWYESLKLLASFVVHTGYKGMIILIDELVNLYKIPVKSARQYNYEKLLMMYNDVLQGKAQYIGIFMGGTPECIEDNRTGLFSYEALRSRLQAGRYSSKSPRDLLAPIIYLDPLSEAEVLELLHKLAEIHANLYNYNCMIPSDNYTLFLKNEYMRLGAEQNITPREVIRDFIEILNILYQNPDKNMKDIIDTNHYGTFVEKMVDEEFAEFEV